MAEKTASTKLPKIAYMAGMIFFSAAAYFALVKSIQLNMPFLAYPLVVLISPVMMWIVRYGLEDNRPKGLFNPKTQSWAFLGGDTFVLPFAAFFLAMATDRANPPEWSYGATWRWGALTFGYVVAAVYHEFESLSYRQKKAGSRIESPTKRYHDFGVYGALFGAFFATGVPVLFGSLNAMTGLAAIALIFWAILGLVDMGRGLKPEDLHPEWIWPDTFTFSRLVSRVRARVSTRS